MLFWMRHASCRRVENDIYDPSARIVKNHLNSRRRVNSTRRRVKFYIEI